jgi:hypothetical protein
MNYMAILDDKIPFSKLLTAEIGSKLSCLCIIFKGILCTKNFWNHVDSKQKCPKSPCNSFATGGTGGNLHRVLLEYFQKYM